MIANRPASRRAAVLALALTAALAACGSDKKDTSTASTAPASTSAPAGSTATSAAPGSSAPETSGAAVDLKDVCPATIVVQTDWWPEAEHGSLYELLGPGYKVDSGKKSVSGPLVAAGKETGVNIEIRAGGPAITGGVAATMYTDTGITLGYATTEGQIFRNDKTPLVSVVAPLEKNPQMLMWDPATYPDVKTIADLKTNHVTVNVFQGGRFPSILVAMGLLDQSQIDPSYDGTPARFVAEQGKIAQQGFATAEPYTYSHDIEQWAKPVAFQTLHDAGYQPYSQTLGMRPDDKAKLAPCLKKFVPVVQQAAVDYVNSPDAADATIVDVVKQFNGSWSYSEGLAAFSAKAQKDGGYISNGPDQTLGNIDPARIQKVFDLITSAGLNPPAGVTPDSLYTNEFIDPSIGL